MRHYEIMLRTMISALVTAMAPPAQTNLPAPAHDFDFMIGSWKIHNHFLKERLCGSTDWIEYDARYDLQLVLGGLGNIDRYKAIREGRTINGMTLRLFNPASGEWSLYWADNLRVGILQPAMVGKFKGDVAEFFGDEEVDGKKVLCRFRWLKGNPESPQWEQAFSNDGGKTWETNWIMVFTREEHA